MEYLETLKSSQEFDYWLGASNEEVLKAENLLGIKFPDDYRTFISQCGMCNFGDTVILGIAKDKSKISYPVVEVTLELREILSLNKKYFVIRYEYGEYIILYNLYDHKIYEADLRYGDSENLMMDEVYESYLSFNEFFNDFILLESEDNEEI